MQKLYSILWYILLPLVMLRLVWRGIGNRAYWQRWSERFGYIEPIPKDKPVIWIHAVSVGEVNAARPLMQALKTHYPSHQFYLTTTTPTGSAQAKKIYKSDVSHSYLPYDFPGAVKRFLNRVHPVIAVIMETEIWPNIFKHCKQKRIPLLIANARISEKAFSQYLKIKSFIAPSLLQANYIAAQSKMDAERFKTLGAAPENVKVTGNVKFDMRLPDDFGTQAKELREWLGKNRMIWIVASTHEDEEARILTAYAQLKQAHPQLLLVLVPRHPERFQKVYALCTDAKYKTQRRSEHRPVKEKTSILLVDTMGELQLFIGAGDIAFIGGSLVPIGGHNILEACVAGKPVLFGPHMENFQDISQLALRYGAGYQIKNIDELVAEMKMLLKQDSRREKMSVAGLKLVEENRGARQRICDLAGKLIR